MWFTSAKASLPTPFDQELIIFRDDVLLYSVQMGPLWFPFVTVLSSYKNTKCHCPQKFNGMNICSELWKCSRVIPKPLVKSRRPVNGHLLKFPSPLAVDARFQPSKHNSYNGTVRYFSLSQYSRCAIPGFPFQLMEVGSFSPAPVMRIL